MSTVSIRAALEGALNSMTPAVSTAWENVPFTPTVGTAYQQVFVIFAEPDNAETHSAHMELGYMQVDLMYPENTGSGAAMARAELIRTTFYRGATFSSGAVNVLVTNTPEIARGEPEEGRYPIRVKIKFQSFIP